MNADMSYITEDDPAEESLEDICRTVAGYVESKGGKYSIIYDRGEAIKQAIADCNGDGIVLLAGKGAETHQKRGIASEHYEGDAYFAKKYLAELNIPIITEDLGGVPSRKIIFDPATFKVLLKRISQ